MDARIDKLIARMEKSRAQLDAALEKLAPQQDIYPTWKVKQLMDHITGWDELVAATLQAYSRGVDPVMMMADGIDHYNSESISARKDVTLEKSRRDYQEARAKVLRLLRGLPVEIYEKEFVAPWGGQCTVEGIMKIFVSHEREHARHIEAVLRDSAGE
ncbi:MAG: hypothetical protein C3F13_08860 [Anaerolineales bacterium]|nr:DinB family protein [Anaerolineae bacterium]PWB53515.1 MAG: hypothetical protein C3F13_08860 [Anaerolineales bacterium]